jgi:hypothetical protein
LIARRLVERGVRFVQIYSGGMENQLSWDCHADLVGNHRGFARETDQPVAALLADLEQRGLLNQTLVIWGGEFGRLPVSQKGERPGRDHNPHAFTVWLAGGGVKGGLHYGQTDEIGFKAALDKQSACPRFPRHHSCFSRLGSRKAHLPLSRAGSTIDWSRRGPSC